MLNVLPLRGIPEARSLTYGEAMREAREVAGLDLDQAVARLNRQLGCSIISAALLELWEDGRERPDVLIWMEAVRAAGTEALRIIAATVA